MCPNAEIMKTMPISKRKAVYWIRKFQRDLHLPRCVKTAVDQAGDLARYKLPICVLLSYLELNIKKENTDFDEARVMINCIKRTLPNPSLRKYQRRCSYLDNAINELK